MLELLKKNLEQEKRIVNEIIYINQKLITANESEKSMYMSSLNSFRSQLKILNNAIPLLIEDYFSKKNPRNIPVKQKGQELIKLAYTSPKTQEKRFLAINKEDRRKFSQDLKLSEASIKSIRKTNEKIMGKGIQKPSIISKIANSIFLGMSEKISPVFGDVSKDLKEANIRLFISTYISIALLVSSLSFILGAGIILVLYILKINIIKFIWLPFVLSILSFICFYFYPATEKSSFKKKVSNELPFATIYMAAIAGSNIEPVKIFRIISKSAEYPSIGIEIKKLLSQIDIYGIDLVNALKNSSKKSTNKKYSELLNGLATNIISGGSLKNYLEKKSENFMLDYKLERRRYASLAETLMDIYIAILITGPLILVVLISVMNVAKISFGIPFNTIMILTLGAIVLINIIFLGVIQIKQPTA